VIPEAIRKLIIPGDEVFYALFNTGAISVVKMTRCLNDILLDIEPHSEKWTYSLQELKTYYGESRENYRQTVKRLSKVFITPIDRVQVHQLSVDLHSIARSIYLVPRSVLWDVDYSADTYIQMFGQLLTKASLELERMVDDIGSPKRNYVMKHSRELYILKREMEIAYDHALQSLYQNTFNPAKFTGRLDTYNSLKDVGDYCRNAAHTAEGIVLTQVG
jgi:uncharacterized protein Yka (UPF0111/DUF47 family)